MKAAIITIGDELLLGTTIDTNSAYIGKSLQTINVAIDKKCTIGDDAHAITQALLDFVGKVDLLVVTGGLGPTKDDITKKTIASFVNRPLVMDDTILHHVLLFFQKRNRPMLDVNRDQALIIEGSTILFNRMGTAPGLLVHHSGTDIIILPGVPFEMRNIWDEEVMPRLAQKNIQGVIIHRYVETAGIGESFLAQEIEDIENALPPYIKLAYLPSLGGVTLRLTAQGTDASIISQEVDAFHGLIIERVKAHVYATEAKSLATYIVESLKQQRLTMATAESCTGGGLASAITDVPGASEVYMGSIISYDNGIKQDILTVPEEVLLDYGAVSSQVVTFMAEKGKDIMQTDICIAISGILGPSGGTDSKPVGTVFVAIAYRDHHTVVKEFHLPYDRLRNKELLIIRCLDMLRGIIQDK